MNVLPELFIVFFKLGAFTIGGGIAMLPLLQNTLIEEKKWFTKEEFVDAVAVCQSLPGVVAINMATYVGYKKKGLIGSLTATLGVTLPSFVLILMIARGVTAFGDNPAVMGAMAGLRAAALRLVVVAVIQLAPAATKNRWGAAAALLSFVLIALCNINTAYVILLFIVLGILSTLTGGKKAADSASAAAETGREDAPSAALSGGDGADRNFSVIERDSSGGERDGSGSERDGSGSDGGGESV